MRRFRNIIRFNGNMSCFRRSSQRHSGQSPPSAANINKDDATLVTPPPVNHSHSSTPTSSLPTLSAAAFDGKSFDGQAQQQPRIMQSLHGMSPQPVAKQVTPAGPTQESVTPKLLTMHSARKMSSSTTPGPVTRLESSSSKLLRPLLHRH